MRILKTLTTRVLFFLPCLVFAQHTGFTLQEDVWSGMYRLVRYSEKEIDTTTVSIFVIEKTKDANPEEIPAKYKDDVLRWKLFAKNRDNKDTLVVRNFLMTDDTNEYEEFGWSQLHKSGKINCLDGGHFFLCSTASGSTITPKGEEAFVTKTGFFMVILHGGLFDVYKVE